MTRFAKIYGEYFYKYENVCNVLKHNSMNREGYGYIKRRVGLLSNELCSPTYTEIAELSNLIQKNKIKP